MLPKKIAFVDIETTGTRAFYDRIIEIGILRVEENKIVNTFQTLINPEGYVPREITMMTGITPEDVENAPTFRQIKKDILEMLEDCIFVAHNVRFDYGFLKNEFGREEINFRSKHFCTVQLSRMLYPEYRHHNLDSLIERHGFEVGRRHRAFDDANVLVNFYKKVQTEFPLEHLEKLVDRALKKPSIPINLKTDVSKIPERPGVYIFYGEKGAPLYIGKSINLHERILSHFSSDIRSPLEMKISQQIESIECIETAGELGALLLESKLIKQMLPLYNKKSRIKRELLALKSRESKDGYMEAFLEPITKISFDEIDNELKRDGKANSFLGFFKSRKQAKNFLAEIAKKYNLCEKLLGIEAAHLKMKTPCFAYRLGRCKGACVGLEKTLFYNLKFITAFASTKIKSWPFDGPVVITETDGRKKDCFLINKWCYLGEVKFDKEGNENMLPGDSPAFDLDIYNILKHYFENRQNYKYIKLLKSDLLIQANF